MSGGFHDCRLVTAAKPHRCEECSRTISEGETYQRAAGKWEGDFWSMVTCAHCAAFREIADAYDDCFWECMYGGLSDWVYDGGADAHYDCRWPWEQRMALFRQLRQFRNGWHGGRDPIPDPRWIVAGGLPHHRALPQIIDRLFPAEAAAA